jgi:hypothetical protein
MVRPKSPDNSDGRSSVLVCPGRFCVLTPRIGTRLLHKGDENLLRLAKECERFIPFVA